MKVPVRPPAIIRAITPGLVWKIPSDSKVIYLTFDDGPIPGVTPWVLDRLQEHKARATFFCVGDNAVRNPSILRRISQEGHSIGNHTHNHLNGWTTDSRKYLDNIRQANRVLHSQLFRPPYGRIRPGQLSRVRASYKVIMWSVLTIDYDATVAPEQCLSNSLKAGKGDIVLFHDSIKAQKNLEYALPRFLDHYSNLGFRFEPII